MKTSETLGKIAPALVAALSEMTGAAKDSKNPHFKNSYASLESVIDASRPVLASHGLAFMQGLGEYVNGAMTVSTRIIHDSGEWIESDFQMPVGKPDPQGTASASTYARRYALMSILGLPAVDDDGEAAMQPHRGGKPQPVEPTRKSAAQAKRDGDDGLIKTELAGCTDLEMLGVWAAMRLPHWLAICPKAWEDPINDFYLNRRDEILEGEM